MKLYILLFILTVACSKSPDKIPSLKKYKNDTSLMIKICEKLSRESNAKTLNRVADSTFKSRVVSCFDYVGECNKYGKFLTEAVNLSKDGVLSSDDVTKLRSSCSSIKAKVKIGRKKLEEHYR